MRYRHRMRYWLAGHVQWYPRRSFFRGYGVGTLHAGRGGRLLLRWEVSWRNLAGLTLNLPFGQLFFYLRRVIR